MKKRCVSCRLAAVAMLLVCVACGLSACYEAPEITVTDANDLAGQTTVSTTPVPQGQLTFSSLISVMAVDMKWSDLSAYTHAKVDDTHAVFQVMDSDGKECELAVTFDAAADVVAQATLTYGDITVDVLADDITVALRTIMIAMNEN